VWQRCTQGVNGALNLLTQPYRPDRGTAFLITLGSHRDLTREAVEAVAWGGERLALAPAVLERVAAGQAELLALLAGGARVDGVNTGMGFFATVDLDEAARAGHQRNLLLGRAVGGPPWLPAEEARALLRRAEPAAGLRGLGARLAELVAPVDQDRPLGQDLAALVAALERDELRLP